MLGKGFIVLGVNRSGTSAVASALRALGVYFGLDKDLPRTSFRLDYEHCENARVVEMCSSLQAEFAVNGIPFQALPADWRSFPDVPSELNMACEFIEKYFGNHPAWGWKDPRATLLTPFFDEVFERLKAQILYLFTIRRLEEVAAGLAKRQGMSPTEAAGFAIHYTLNGLTAIDPARLRPISYERLCADPQAVLAPIWKEANLPEPTDEQWTALRSSVKPARSPKNDHPPLPEFALRVSQALQSLAEGDVTTIRQLKLEWEEMLELTRMPQVAAGQILWRCGPQNGAIPFQGERHWFAAKIGVQTPNQGEIEIKFSNLLSTFYVRKLAIASDVSRPTARAGKGAYVDFAPDGRMRILPYADATHLVINVPPTAKSIEFEVQLECSAAALIRVGSRLGQEKVASAPG